MANTTSRSLRLLTLLQTHRFWPGPELADRLGVTDRTLRRDIDRLRDLGYPVRSSRGTDGGYQLAAGATMPPLVVDAEEAVAIVVALRAATLGAAAVLGDAPVRALAKVTQVLPKPLRRRVNAVSEATVAPELGDTPPVELETLTTIAQACRDGVRLEFAYVARDANRTRRRVEPYHLVPVGRRWYLVAHDLGRADWRSFRLDRMADVVSSTIPVATRTVPGDDPVEYVRRGLRGGEQEHRVTCRVTAPLAEVAPSVGRWGELAEETERTTLLTMTASEWYWIAFGIVSLPHPVEILTGDDDGELRALLRDWSERASTTATQGA
ncbi:MAG TPA: YafY family transcriptional regulator [Candidatus Avipropionibacterium avicola]|uniref:YafY family transcriptional regulator n=1 Tax=Candidatus Avipropionibacterium avicola TaxID=2840701 RepID=A0A9D1GYQ9_9ACTN|nr:YafY family transcriptional regulator [Candidatus Avipropionibacterium avicola]